VKTGDNVFGECLQHDYSLLFVCTERDDYTDKRYVD
jgi:hypothetical protein